MEHKIALFIFSRRLRIESGKTMQAFVSQIQASQKSLEELEEVIFLHDCFKRAMQKVTRAWAFEAKVNRKWKDYDKFVTLIPLIREHRVNPFAFFHFKIEDLREKKIFPKIANVVTKKALDHFLGWRRKNSYRVSVAAQEKSYEKEWLNQITLDMQSLITYELRRPVVALTSNDDFLFSGLGKALFNHFHQMKFPLELEEESQWQELLENKPLYNHIIEYWNRSLDLELMKLGDLRHSLRDANFLAKLNDISKMLSVLRIPTA